MYMVTTGLYKNKIHIYNVTGEKLKLKTIIFMSKNWVFSILHP